jgi:hypothetical protein
MTVGEDPSPYRLEGKLVYLQPATAESIDQLSEFDWARSALAEMGGWFRRPPPIAPWGTMLYYDVRNGRPAGVVDAAILPGYPGVANLSIFCDAEAAPGLAMHAYALFVELLFQQGFRLIHHEVLEFNQAVLGILKGIAVEPSARYREHAFTAGRLWDVVIYSYDETHFRQAFRRFERRVRAPAVG